jgi:hypothetical protein
MARAVTISRPLLIPIAIICLIGTVLLFGAAQEKTKSSKRTLSLIPYQDPWTKALPRWLDIDDRRFHDFINKMGTPQEFSYQSAQVVLSYDDEQSGGVFRGHIEARGLKPNFAYQIKLCGKPKWGRRGWNEWSDDVANANLGFQGRWWDDSVQQNGWDRYYWSLYVKAPPERRHSMVGYLFIGVFVTDEKGDASHDFASEKPLHITWQNKQYTTLKHHQAGTYVVGSAQAPFVGYGGSQAPRSVKLWYEHEAKRPSRVTLPPGRYNCRLLLTEESFHAKNTAGGQWLTVLATEDFAAGRPDAKTENDLVFEMKK